MKIGKVKKLLANLIMIKKEYVVHIRILKQQLDHGLVLAKVKKVIKSNEKPGLKLYINLNTEQRKN